MYLAGVCTRYTQVYASHHADPPRQSGEGGGRGEIVEGRADGMLCGTVLRALQVLIGKCGTASVSGDTPLWIVGNALPVSQKIERCKVEYTKRMVSSFLVNRTGMRSIGRSRYQLTVESYC